MKQILKNVYSINLNYLCLFLQDIQLYDSTYCEWNGVFKNPDYLYSRGVPDASWMCLALSSSSQHLLGLNTNARSPSRYVVHMVSPWGNRVCLGIQGALCALDAHIRMTLMVIGVCVRNHFSGEGLPHCGWGCIGITLLISH